MTTPIESKKPENPSVAQTINVWSTAGEVGLLIALPLVLLILLGIKLDKKLGTTPLFIIVAMISSMVLSTIAIARKIRQLNNK